MFPFRLLDRLKFFVERQFIKGPHYQFLAMALVLALVALIGGVLVLGTGEERTLSETVWWAFLRLSDPGYLGDDVGVRRRLVAIALTMSGYVLVMGSVVAILTRWLISSMRQLEQGLTPIVMKDHILILGWTDRTIPVLRELILSTTKVQRFLAKRGRKQRVRMAVLAEDITPEITHELRQDPAIEKRLRDVVLRSGSDLDVRHLQRVASLHASAIILPTEVFDDLSHISSDVRTIKTLLSLQGLPRKDGENLPYVVAEIQDIRKLPITRRAYTGPLEVIAGDAVISELMVQTLHHPGLSLVFGELLNAGTGNEIVIQPHPELAGETFDDTARLFDEEILCGVVRREKDILIPHLNPRHDFELQASDGLVFVAAPNAEFAADATVTTFDADTERRRLAEDGTLEIRHRKILILGWSQKVIAVLRELTTYRNEVVEVTVLASFSATERAREIEGHGIDFSRGACRHLDADYTVSRELRAVDPASFDDIIFISSDRMAAGEEADARTIVGYLCLEEVLDDSAERPHILVELADAHNKKLLGNHTDEVIISPLLVSHVLAQVAMHRGLRRVLEELFTAGGAEITFRTALDYDIQEEKMSFRKIRARARQYGDILIGVGDQLNPPASRRFSLDATPRLVVITTITNGEVQP